MNHEYEIVTSLEDSTGEDRAYLRCITCGVETDYLVHEDES